MPSKTLLEYCVKFVQIRSYFWAVFSCIRTEYGYSPNAGKYGPEITPYLDIFHAVQVLQKQTKMQSLLSKNGNKSPFFLRPFDFVKSVIYLKIILLTTTRICVIQSHQFCALSFYVIYLPFRFILDNFSEKAFNLKKIFFFCKLRQYSCQR